MYDESNVHTNVHVHGQCLYHKPTESHKMLMDFASVKNFKGFESKRAKVLQEITIKNRTFKNI